MTKCDLGSKNGKNKYNVFDYVGDLFSVTSRHTTERIETVLNRETKKLNAGV